MFDFRMELDNSIDNKFNVYFFIKKFYIVNHRDI